MIFCAWDYRSEPIFRRRLQCDVQTPSDSLFEAVYKQRNAVQHFSTSTRTEQYFLTSESLGIFENFLFSTAMPASTSKSPLLKH